MKKLVLVLLVMSAFARSKAPIDQRIKDVHSIFVAGNNQAAEQVRSEIQKDAQQGKGCFTLATNPKDADATFDLATDTAQNSHLLDTRSWIVAGTLTLKSNDLIWSHSERFSDAPFSSGGKVAGKLLYLDLRHQACGK